VLQVERARACGLQAHLPAGALQLSFAQSGAPLCLRIAFLGRSIPNPDLRVQIICLTSSQTSMAIHAKVTTAMTPNVIQRTIVPTARFKTPADENGGV